MKNLTIVAVILIFMACENEPSSSFVAHETEVDETQTDLSLTDETQNPDSDEEGSIIKDVDSDSETADISEEGTDTPQIVDEDTEEDTDEVNDEVPEEYCGNGVVDSGEVCDGQIDVECSDISDEYTSGAAKCLNTCDGYNETACSGDSYSGPYEIDLTINGENIVFTAEEAKCLYTKSSRLLQVDFLGEEGLVLTAFLFYDTDILETPDQPLKRSHLNFDDNGTNYGSAEALDFTIDFLGKIETHIYLKGTLEFFGPLGGGTMNTDILKFKCEIPEEY